MPVNVIEAHFTEFTLCHRQQDPLADGTDKGNFGHELFDFHCLPGEFLGSRLCCGCLGRILH